MLNKKIQRGHFSLLMTCASCCLVVLCAATIRAQDGSQSNVHRHGGHHEHGEKKDKSPEQIQQPVFPDVEILNQDGRKQKFYTDLIKGRRVIINFVYTSCTDICPLSGANFAKLQSILGARLGKDVHLVSITTDPATDSPQKLKAWSERFKPQAGWTLVTGEKAAMQTLLQALTGEGPRRGFHTPIAVLGNDGIAMWKRTYGLESPAMLVEMLDALSVKSE